MQMNEKHENGKFLTFGSWFFFLSDSQFAFISLFSVWLICLVFYVAISCTSKTSLKQKGGIKFILVLYLLEKYSIMLKMCYLFFELKSCLGNFCLAFHFQVKSVNN